jgi:chromate reductase, NAD(P)H dehydrogenase (quinone)
MYTIIACTNRVGSNTKKVATAYQKYFKEQGVDAQLFSLEEITMTERNEAFVALENKYLISTDKYIFIAPEYNGSFPGIMKLMMDMSQVDKCWHHKKALLTGLATGRAGNLRGLDMMSNIFHYLKMDVHKTKIPLSAIQLELENDVFIKEETVRLIKEQIRSFINF